MRPWVLGRSPIPQGTKGRVLAYPVPQVRSAEIGWKPGARSEHREEKDGIYPNQINPPRNPKACVILPARYPSRPMNSQILAKGQVLTLAVPGTRNFMSSKIPLMRVRSCGAAQRPPRSAPDLLSIEHTSVVRKPSAEWHCVFRPKRPARSVRPLQIPVCTSRSLWPIPMPCSGCPTV